MASRSLKLTKPIVFFDTETTGPDPNYDRIVEISLLKLYPDNKKDIMTLRVNPQIKIPKEATNIHGITNEDVAHEKTFGEIAPLLLEFFHNSDLAGYNVTRFDSLILKNEFEKNGFQFNLEDKKIIDVMTIFHLMEKRDLSAAYAFYCKKELVGAHGAEIDNKATEEILRAQLERYGDLPTDIDNLHDFCKVKDERFVDESRKFIWRDGVASFNYWSKKHKYKSLEEVVSSDKSYLEWMLKPESDFSREVKEIVSNALEGKFTKK